MIFKLSDFADNMIFTLSLALSLTLFSSMFIFLFNSEMVRDIIGNLVSFFIVQVFNLSSTAPSPEMFEKDEDSIPTVAMVAPYRSLYHCWRDN